MIGALGCMLPLRICWQLEVCDDNNCAFLLKLLATIGANVPPTSCQVYFNVEAPYFWHVS